MREVHAARASIAALKSALEGHESDVGALRDALVLFNTPAVLEIALRVERTVERIQRMQDAAVAALSVARVQAPGALDADLDGLRALAGRVAEVHQRTAALAHKLQGFTRAHVRALTQTEPSRGYDRRARISDGATLSLLQGAG
jgi:hypothetical protein